MSEGKKRTILDAWLHQSKKHKENNPPESTTLISELTPLGTNSSPSTTPESEPFSDLEVDAIQQRQAPHACHSQTGTNSKILVSDAEFKNAYFIQNRPENHFNFPKDGNRSCHADWFKKFSWLHYDEKNDSVFCYECMKTLKFRPQSSQTGVEQAFLTIGFRKWKNGLQSFRKHEISDFHQQSVHLNVQRLEREPINSLLSSQLQKEQETARNALKAIVSSLRYLTRTGQAIRGHGHDDGNLMALLEERENDVSSLKVWLKRRDKWLSNDIQNEIIEIMSHSIQRDIIKEIKESQFFGIIADGSTDVSGNEQFSICIRFVDTETLKTEEHFIGFVNPPDATAETLSNCIKDVLLRLTLSVNELRGHCFDGAANMAGRLNGVQRILCTEQPKSMFVHCTNHALDLVLQEISKKCGSMCDTLIMVRDLSNIIRESSKRKKIYENILLPPCVENDHNIGKVNHLLPLCPTRWSIRGKALTRFLENFSRVSSTVNEILEDLNSHHLSDERKSVLRGYSKKLEKFETAFFLFTGVKLFGPCEQLSKALQKPDISATGAKHAAKLLSDTLQKFRSEDSFNEVFELTTTLAVKENLRPIAENRVRKRPKKLEHTDNPTYEEPIDPKVKLRKEYFEILDMQIAEIERRFNQSGLQNLINLEEIVLHSVGGKTLNKDQLIQALGIYGSDFNIDRLQAQLQMLPGLGCKDMKSISISDIADKLRCESTTVRSLLNEVVRLTALILTVPASSASAERSFSLLRRLKTYLRTTMTQKRLTHTALLYEHCDRTAQIDINLIMKEFISRTSERKTTFGKI